MRKDCDLSDTAVADAHHARVGEASCRRTTELCVIVADNETEAEEAIARADAAFGTVSPAVLRAASKLRWIQAPQAAPPAAGTTPS